MGVDLNRTKRVFEKLMCVVPELASIKECAVPVVDGLSLIHI